ncbi:heme NO-binding domain-containing protein [bacterium]|nr:heme NO-binding domain-containing protein [bacterium]MBU1958337.1 heme NO-binding domain-containing protein [bacterium]
MRGLIFTELFELVEDRFGYELLDDIIVEANLPNDGAYASTGNYPFSELQTIIVKLHEHTNIPIETLLQVFGEYLFTKLFETHPQFDGAKRIIDFLENVETYIHIEVKKLYPDAELPKFDIVAKDENSFTFYYISSKQLHHLAKGLILGASKYFNQPVTINMKVEEENKRTLFSVTQV